MEKYYTLVLIERDVKGIVRTAKEDAEKNSKF